MCDNLNDNGRAQIIQVGPYPARPVDIDGFKHILSH